MPERADELLLKLIERVDAMHADILAVGHRVTALESRLLQIVAAQAGVDPMFTDAEVAVMFHKAEETIRRLRWAGPEKGGLRFYREGGRALIGASHLADHQRAIETPKRKEGLRVVKNG